MPLLITWLQEPAFLPDELGEWLAAIATAGTLAIMVYGLFRLAYKMGLDRKAAEDREAALRLEIATLKAEMDRRFKEHGERIGAIHGSCEGSTAAIHALENRVSLLSLEVSGNTREVSAFSGKSAQMETAYNAGHQANTEARAQIRERLARLEAQVQQLQQLNRSDG